MIKPSVSETKWSSLLARTRALILYISIWMFDFGPEKLPGLSRNGPQTITGADPGCFLGGGALVSCSTSTPINHIVLFCRIPVKLENRRSSQGEGGMRTPCTLPLDPPLHYTGNPGNSGNSVPYSLRRVRGFFNVSCWLYNTEDAIYGAYDLSSLSEKARTSYHLQMSLQRQHILLSYFKTLSVSPVWGSNPRPPAQQSGALPTELTGRRFRQKRVSYRLTNLEEKYPGKRSFKDL